MRTLTTPFRLGFLITVLALAVLPQPGARAQTIPNPSFEANTFAVYPGYASGNGGGISGWVLSDAGRIGLNPSGGSPFANDGATPHGANVAFIQGSAALSTTIGGLTAGVSYRVSFRANMRAGYAAPAPSWSLDGGAFTPFPAAPPVGGANPYYTVSGTFTATGATAPLAVRNESAADTTVLLDGFAIAPVPGDFGNALSLNGNSQYVSVPGGVWFSNQFTVEAWVYVRSYDLWSRLLEFGNGGGNNNALLALSDGVSGQPTFHLYDGVGTRIGTVLSPSPLPLNTWTHLAFTFDGTTGTILLNGVPMASGAMSAPLNVVRTMNYLGQSLYGGDAYANAVFDEFRLWSTARSPAQIQAGLSGPIDGNTGGLLLYYRLDETAGTVAANSATATGASANGTLVNGPAWVSGARRFSEGPFSVGFNFNGSSLPADVAGVPGLAQANWNNLTTASDGSLHDGTFPGNGPAVLKNAAGLAAAPIPRLWWAAQRVGSQSTPNTADGRLMAGDIRSGCNEGTNVLNLYSTCNAQPFFSVAGLPADVTLGGYKVLIYASGMTDYVPDLGSIVRSTACYWLTSHAAENPANVGSEILLTPRVYLHAPPFNGTYIRATTNVDGGNYNTPDGNYVMFEGRTESGFTVRTEEVNSVFGTYLASICAVQIVRNPVVVVTTAADELDPVSTSGTGVSLREAVRDAVAGGGIIFAPALSGQTLTLEAGRGEIALTKGVTIDASSLPGGFTVDGGPGNNRIFNISVGQVVSLVGLTLTGGNASPGGAIYSAAGSALTVMRCTLTGNDALEGGAILNDGRLSLVQCTLSGNTSGYGGALQCRAPATLSHCTLSGNTAGYGGGVYNKFTTLTVANTIIGGNSSSASGRDIYCQGAALVYAGANLIPFVVLDPTAPAPTGPAPITAAPLLSPLGHYGGPMQTMPPLPGSPALDAAVGSPVTPDQRGYPRPLDGDGNGSAVADLGAVESRVIFVTTAVDELNPVGTPGTGYSLREALRDAATDTFIGFANSLNGQTVALTNELVIERNVQIDTSSLSAGLTLHGGAQGFRLFSVVATAHALLSRLTLTGGGGSGNVAAGGAVRNDGALTLSRCTLSGNSVNQWGGAIYSTGPLALNQCTLAANSAGLGGGAIYGSGPVTLTHSTLAGNSAANEGGGIVAFGPLTLDRSIVAGNSLTRGNGADISHSSGVTYVSANIVQSRVGSGVVNGPAAITSAPLLAAFGSYGGPMQTMPPLPGSPAMDAGGGSTAATDQRGFPRPVDGNLDGSAVADLGAAEAQVVQVNTANDEFNTPSGASVSLREAIRDAAPGSIVGIGAGGPSRVTLGNEIVLNKNIMISGSRLVGGLTVDGGPGANRIFSVDSGTIAYLSDLTLTNGNGAGATSSGYGGAIENQGSLALVRCTLAGNSATQFGGAIDNYSGSATLTRCTLTGNSASRSGGAINCEGGFLALDNSTLVLNAAANSGGGIFNSRGAATLDQCTVCSNTASAGGGIASYADPMTHTMVRGTIVSGNRGSDVDVIDAGPNSFSSAGHNLIGGGNAFAAFYATGDSTNISDPRLLPFGDYGGSILTMHPAPGSPAVDAGSMDDPGGTDQRGFSRVVNRTLDIGAVESFFGPVLGYFAVLKVTDPGPPATDKVEVSYDLVDPGLASLGVTLEFSRNAGISWAPATGASGAVGASITPGSARRIVWNAIADLGEVFTTQARVRVTATEPPGSVVGRAAQSTTVASQNITLDTRPRFVTVKGRVMDSGGTPIPGVTVTMGNLPAVMTGASGEYVVPNVPRAGGLLGATKLTYSPQSRLIETIAGIREHVMDDIRLTRLAFQVSGLTRKVGGIYLGGNMPFQEEVSADIDWGQRVVGRVDFLLDGAVIKRISNPPNPWVTSTLDMANRANGLLPYSRKQLRVVAVAADGEQSVAATEDLEFVGVDWLLALNVKAQQVGGWNVEPRYTIAASWPPPLFQNPFPDLVIFKKPALDLSVNLGMVYAPRSGDWQFWLGDPGVAGVRSDWRPAGLEKDAAGFTIAFKNITIVLSAFASGHASRQGFGFRDASVLASLNYNQRIGEACLTDILSPAATRVLSTLNDICEEIGYDFNSLQCIRFDLDLTGTLQVNAGVDNGKLKFRNGQFTAGGKLSGYYKPDLGKWIVFYGKLSGGVAVTFAVPQFEYCNTRLTVVAEAGAYIDWGYSGRSGASGTWVLLDRTFGNACPGFAAPAPVLLAGAIPGAAPEAEGAHVFEVLPVIEKRILSGLPAIPPGEIFVANNAPAAGPPPVAPAAPASPASQNEQVLVQNVSSNSTHALAARGSELMMVYARPASPATVELVWSRFNGSAWSTPAAVPGAVSPVILDPTIAYDGPGNVVLAWQQTGNVTPAPGSDLTTITAALEVKAAYFSNNVWSTAQFITVNSVYDGEPRLCGPLPNGDLFLLWRQQQPGTNFGARGQLLSRRWTTATRTWAGQTTLDAAYAGNRDLACASGPGKVVLAWTVDADGAYTNAIDTEIYYRVWTNNAWFAPVRLTTDAVPDRTPRVAINPSGAVFLSWLKNGQLMFSTNFAAPSVLQTNVDMLGLSDLQLTVGPAGNALLLWSEPYDGGSDGRYAVYDATAGIWGQPSPLWQDRDAERTLRLVWDATGQLATTYFKDRLVSTVQQLTAEDTNGNPVVIIASNIVETASIDLAFTRKSLVSNLTIAAGDLTVAEENFLPGNTIALSAKLSNTGDLAVLNPGLRFTFIPDAGPPIVIANQVSAGWLPAQTGVVFTATWILPANISRGRITATADPAGTVLESNEGDNQQSVTRGGTELIVAFKSKSCYPNGTARVIASVFNAGAPASPASTLELRRGDGSLVATTNVPAVDPGDAYDVILDLAHFQSVVFDTYALRIDPATVNDNDASNNVSHFSVTLPVQPLADATTGEDTPITVPAPVGDTTYTVSVESSNPALVPNSNLLLNGSGPAQTLTLTPLPDLFGATVITMTVSDAVSTNVVSFTLTVNSVNDAPAFAKGPDRLALRNGGPQSANGWATSLSVGPANESAQAFLGFVVSNDNNALFSAQPAVGLDGRLTFTPAPNAIGTALVTVRLQDSGGTTHGGIDLSAAQTFGITVVSGVPSNGRSIVWVSDLLTNATLGRLSDQRLADLLLLEGYNVTRFNPPDAGAIPATNVTQLNAADLVLLGRSIVSAAFDTPGEVSPWNTAVTKPVLAVNSYLTRSNRLGWFTGNNNPDALTSVLNFSNPSDPVSIYILGGAPLTNGATLHAIFQQVPLPAGGIDRGLSVNTDLPVTGATNLATTLTPAAGQFLVAWPAGTPLTGNAAGQSLAGYRMQFLAGNREAAVAPDNTTASSGFNNLTVLGESLFLRAVRVALNGGTLPASSVVLNTNDAGAGSLRAVVAEAPSVAHHTITFAAILSGQTIGLTSGQIVLDKNLTIDASALPGGIRIDGNRSSRAFVVNAGTAITLERIALVHGVAAGSPLGGYGAGIFNSGTLTLRDCSVAGGSAFAGGAAYNGGNGGAVLTLINCTLSGNSASFGGALQNEATTVATNTTFAGNFGATEGGAISAPFGQPVLLVHCTLSGNTSAQGGGLRIAAGGTTIQNTIVAGNNAPSGPDIFGSFTALGLNLTDGLPLLAPLGHYGGPTPTLPPLPGSPALDAGSDAAAAGLATDQRGLGFPRVLNGRVDIGALEGAYDPPVQFTSATVLPEGAFRSTFNSDSGIPFLVLASPQVTRPLSLWNVLGGAVEAPPGQFYFTDVEARNFPQRFYAVTPGYLPPLRWASRVLGFSSQYDSVDWSAAQALGAPDTYPSYGDIATAWASADSDAQSEFLELGFDAPAPIHTVSIYETLAPGAVTRVSVRNPAGLWVEVWSGPATAAPAAARIFTVTFPLTPFPVDAVRLDLNSPAVPDWNEIDAVGINW